LPDTDLAGLLCLLSAKHRFCRESSGRAFGDDGTPLTDPIIFLARKKIGYCMTHPAHRGDDRISRVHSMAICKEIGERLGISLDLEPLPLSPQLIKLMARLRDEP
jgi:hypothetical protein